LKRFKRIAAFLLALFFLFPQTGLSAEYISPWAEEYIKEGIAIGIISDDGQSDFTAPMSRMEFCEVATGLYSHILKTNVIQVAKDLNLNTDVSLFSDVDSESVNLLAGWGVINGRGNGKFAPYDGITREEAAKILHGMAKSLGIGEADSLGIDRIDGYANFSDKKKISNWANIPVDFVYAAGIMKGVSDTQFNPKGTYTREQSIATFLRLSYFSEEISGYGKHLALIPLLTLVPTIPESPETSEVPEPVSPNETNANLGTESESESGSGVDSGQGETYSSSGGYAVNSKNGKIHIVGKCPAAGTGKNAMTSPVYFNTYEEALYYSQRIKPSQTKPKCGNCWK